MRLISPILASILILGVLIGACKSSGASDGSTESLTLYSGRSETLVQPIIDQFSAATGIEVAVKYASTPQLAATLLEEGSRSPADLFFAQDPGGLGVVEDMLTTLSPETLNQAPDWAQSPEGKWIGLSGRARTVVFNTDTLTVEDLPDDIWGFTDPAWKGRLGWPPSNASFQTMVTGMRSVWGEQRTREWLEGIQANEPIVFPKNTPIVAAVGAGEIDAGFVNHYYLHRFLAEQGDEFPARNYHPRAGGPGALVMVAGVGILDTTENQETAERFITFMLSAVAQQYFASQTFEYPLLDNVRTGSALVPMVDIVRPEISMRELSDIEGTQRLLRDTGVLP